MKIIVTGGRGYIGSHIIVELLAAGHEPIIVDNGYNSDPAALDRLQKLVGQSLTHIEIDCNDEIAVKQLFESRPVDGVIHLAAYKAVGESVREPLKYYRNNINSLRVILEAMQEHGVPNIVFSSTGAVYGNTTEMPLREDMSLPPAESTYANTKRIGEDMLRAVSTSDKPLRAVALRYFNVVGAHPSGQIGESPRGVPANLVPFLVQVVAGHREQLTVFGTDYDTPDGTTIRDYIHVVDLAKAHVHAMEHLAKKVSDTAFYDVFNVGTGKGTSVMEMIKTFEKVNNLPVKYTVGPKRGGDVTTSYAATDKIEKTMGWKAEKSIEDGLRDSWRWQQTLDSLNPKTSDQA